MSSSRERGALVWSRSFVDIAPPYHRSLDELVADQGLEPAIRVRRLARSSGDLGALADGLALDKRVPRS
jgi:hypothetical protein